MSETRLAVSGLDQQPPDRPDRSQVRVVLPSGPEQALGCRVRSRMTSIHRLSIAFICVVLVISMAECDPACPLRTNELIVGFE